MLVDADLSGLEWRVGAELCQDPIMIAEIVSGEDIHMANSRAIFGDELHRQDAKIVSFRSLYGGTAYAFYKDPKMPNLPQKQWDKIMEAFKDKYQGLIKWQDRNYKLVQKTGRLQTFTGRSYVFNLEKADDGSWKYSRPAVCNYPVQGTSTGDIVPLVMYQINRKLKQEGLLDVKIVNQVHDSIVFESPKKHVDRLAEICYEYFRNIPQSVKAYWGYDWTVPMDGEVKAGYNWSKMEKIKG